MLYQLDHKLHNQLTASTTQSVLSAIEQTLTGFYHRSRIKHPHSQLLPLLHIPSLAAIAAERQPIYGDLDQHCIPLAFHQHRESLAHSFASSASSSHHPLPDLLQPRPFLLIGRLTGHSTEPTRLQLTDDTASMVCHALQADTSLLQRVVLFPRFNVVYPLTSHSVEAAGGACGVLEVDGQDAVVLDGVETVDWSVLRPLPLHMMDHAQVRKLFKSSSSATHFQPASSFVSSLPLSSARPHLSASTSTSSSSTCLNAAYHLRGCVTAISPIIQQGEQHFFFVDLRHNGSSAAPTASQSIAARSLPSADSTFILFQGAAVMCWYHVLHVDEEYLFTQLRPKAVKLSNARVRLLFVFTTAAPSSVVPSPAAVAVPRVLSARSCQLPAYLSLHVTKSSAAVQPQQAPEVCKWAQTVEYVGTITKQVCAGVYELDHSAVSKRGSNPSSSTTNLRPPPSLRLFVTHYAPIVQDGVLLRPGCVVRLHHVHPLVHSGRFLGFGCCSRSQVAVVQLSPFAGVCKPYDTAGNAALNAHLSRLSLSDAALYLSVMEALLRKWSRHVKSDLAGDGQHNDGLVHRLLSAHIRPHHEPDVYAEVMEHASCKSAVPGSTATNGFPTFPSYSSLFQLPAVVSACENLHLRIDSTDHSATAWHVACIPSSSLLPAGWFVTGYLSPSSYPFKPCTYNIAPAPTTVYVDGKVAPRRPVSSVYTGLQLRESLRDRADFIDCEVRGTVSGEHCGVLYHLPSFQLVLETVPPVLSSSSGPLPPIASAAATARFVVAYLSFSITDAVPLIDRVPRQPSSTLFTSQRTHTSVLMYITHKTSRVAAVSSPGLFLIPQDNLPASTVTSSAASYGHECSLRGLLVLSNVQSSTSVLVHLRPPLLALASIVHVGAVVELSSCRPLMNAPSLDVSDVFETTEECTLRVDQSAAAREWQHAVRSRLPSEHTFPQLLTVDMDEWLDREASRALFSFCGIIIDRQVRTDGFDQSRRLLRPRRSNSAPQHLLHSSSLTSAHTSVVDPVLPFPVPGKLYLRVRDVQSAHVIDVYVPLSQRPYPAGLLVGAVVALSGAVRKLSPSWKIYMECTTTTDIHILSPPPVPAHISPPFAFSTVVPPPPQPRPPSFLSSFTPCPVVVSQLVHRLRCRIHAVKRLSFAVHCLRCAQPLPPANERRQHKSPCGAGGCTRIEFRANGYVQVDDGTHTALVVVDGELISQLLGLTRHEWVEVKKYVGQWGQLLFESSQQQQERQEHDSRQAFKRRREKQERDGEGMEEESDTGSHPWEGKAGEPDFGAMQRDRLFSLFRSRPRLRLVVLHCQQLMFAKDIDAFMDRRRMQHDMKGTAPWKAAGTQQLRSAADRELDTLLASAVPHAFTVGGVQLTTSKPAGVVMLRALDCAEVDVQTETVMLLRQQMQQGHS